MKTAQEWSEELEWLLDTEHVGLESNEQLKKWIASIQADARHAALAEAIEVCRFSSTAVIEIQALRDSGRM